MNKKQAWTRAAYRLMNIQRQIADLMELARGTAAPDTDEAAIVACLVNAYAEVQRARLACRRAAEKEKAK